MRILTDENRKLLDTLVNMPNARKWADADEKFLFCVYLMDELDELPRGSVERDQYYVDHLEEQFDDLMNG